MKIRQMTRADLPRLATISHEAFADDDLNDYLFPRHKQYPGSLKHYQSLRLRTRFVTVGMHGWVVETEESDGEGVWRGEKEIVGYASFLRLGRDEAAGKWRNNGGWGDALERKLLKAEMWYNITFTNRAVNNDRMRSFAFSDFRGIPNRWHLSILAVAPSHQRRGVGAMLVQHGQRLAAGEGIPLTLESSVVGRKLYVNQGFEIVSEEVVGDGFLAVSMVWRGEGGKGEGEGEVEKGEK